MNLKLSKPGGNTLEIAFDPDGKLSGIKNPNPAQGVELLGGEPGFQLTLYGPSTPEKSTFRLVYESREGSAVRASEVSSVQASNNRLRLKLPEALFDGLQLSIRPGQVVGRWKSSETFIEIEIEKEAVSQVTLALPAGAIVDLEFEAFFAVSNQDLTLELGVPLKRESPPSGPFALALKLTAQSGNDAPFLTWSRKSGTEAVRFGFVQQPERWGVSLPETRVRWDGLGGRPLIAAAPDARISGVVFRFPPGVIQPRNGTLELPFEAELGIAGKDFTLEQGRLVLDDRLRLADAGLGIRIHSQLKQPVFLLTGGDGGPLSLHLHQGAQVLLDLDPRDPFIALVGEGQVVASAYVPALKGVPASDADFEHQLASRFVLDFIGEEATTPGVQPKTPCRLTSGGARMTATARPVAIALGGKAIENVQLEKGWLRIDRGEYDLDLEASGRLGYFRKATGRVGVRASSRISPRFAARFEPRIEGAWEDPSGLIEFRDPGAVVTVELHQGTEWKVSGTISGSLAFKRTPQWVADAGEWLSEFFAKAVIRFDGLKLDDLLGSAQKAVSLKFQLDDSWNIRLWRILRFDLTDFRLGAWGFEIGGKLHFTLEGGFAFSGSLPRLAIRLHRGVELDLRVPLAFAGRLSTPAGIRAKMEFMREQSEGRDRVVGRGSLAIPGWSEVGVSGAVGRRRVTRGTGSTREEKWIGLFFLFVEADIPITLFPAVVLRQMGLGFGINQKLRGFSGLHENPDGVLSLMQDPRGLPDPANPADWEDGGGYDHTDLALVARTHIAPSPEGRGPFPYLADALLYIQPTSDLCLAFTSSVWLFTGMDDLADDPEFRRRPVAQTVIVMYPRHGYFEARARTLRNPKMKAAAEPVKWSLGLFQTEFWVKATPDLFMLRVGEMRAELKVPGFELTGSMLYAVRAASGQVLALMRQQLAGGFDLSWSFGLSAGPLRFSVGLSIRARAAYSVLLAGGYLRELGFMFYGQAYFMVSLELRVRLSVEFSLRIKIGWFKIHIHWSFSVSASLSLCIEIQAEALVATKGLALSGRGRLVFRVCGYGFDPTIDFRAGDYRALERARQGLKPLLPPSLINL